MASVVERVAVERDGHWNSRTISILAALALDAGLVWLLYFKARYNPAFSAASLTVAGMVEPGLAAGWTSD
jgi:hypothetical protein